MSSFDLREELSALSNLSAYEIENEHDVRSMTPREVDALLQPAVASVVHDASAIIEGDVLDVYRSILKSSDSIAAPLMMKLWDSLTDGFTTIIDAINGDADRHEQNDLSERKLALDIYAFLLSWFVMAADKVKAGGEEDASAAPKPKRGRGTKASAATKAAKSGQSGWNWSEVIVPTLILICKAFKMRTGRLWGTTADRDPFIDCMTRPVYRIMDNAEYMKSAEIRGHTYKAICLAVKHHGHSPGAQTSILQSLQYSEHLAEPMAELLTCLAKEFDYTQLGDEVLREVAKKEFNAADNTGPKAFSRFLIRLVELLPRTILKHLALLLNHLDSEAYQMRNAIVEIVCALIRELDSVEDDSNKKQIDGLFLHLLERTMDTSSYVRVRVFAGYSKLCGRETLRRPYINHRLKMIRYARDALEDKAATVRKSAISCIIALLQTHPWFIFDEGGLLNEGTFKNQYDKAVAELEEAQVAYDKIVYPDGDDEGQEVEGEGQGPSERKSTSRRKRKRPSDDDDNMDVDGDGGDITERDSIMDSDEGEGEGEGKDEGDPLPRKQPNKKKQAKALDPADLSHLTPEQRTVVSLHRKEMQGAERRQEYYVHAWEFTRTVNDAATILLQLLGSKHKAEVLEAMEFFRTAKSYEIDNADEGIKKMLHLIWSKDNNATVEDGKELKGIRQRLLECYRNLYFDPLEDLSPRDQVNRIAKNMIELTYNSSLAELTSLEEMMRHLMDDNQIHHDIVTKLWQVYGSSRQISKLQRQGAIIILGMLALAKPAIVREKVGVLLDVGLGKCGKADLVLAKYTCIALQRLNGSAKKVKGSLADNTVRYSMDNPIFRKLEEAIETPCRSRDWFAFAEQAINTIYALGDHPEDLADRLIKNFTTRAFMPTTAPETQPQSSQSQASNTPRPSASSSSGPGADVDAMDEDTEMSEKPAAESTQELPGTQESPAPSSSAPSGQAGDAFLMSQLLFVVGHIAIKHIVHLELIEREWKRQKQEKEQVEKAAKGTGEASKKDEDDIDQVAGNAEDEIGERIHGVREQELLYGEGSLLAVYGDLIVQICGSPQKYKNPTLRAAAVLAFSKFLCVSSKFCEENHLLLFKLLETSKDANIRSNIVIALGDVAVSFSTIIDESLNQLYRGLSDQNLIVKKNTLMVLTHLILNGMIKVKGQLGEMAKCLEDEEQRVSDLAKLFFTELAGKDNMIYNNLPDVISHLSVGEHAIDEEAFQSTMRYIFGFIEKEKQAENIVEKLCQRFKLADTPRQWRDVAFCLSLLPFKSERSVKKLIEGMPCYQDKLHDEGVFARFQEILSKAKGGGTKAGKLDTDVHEFEKILDKHRQKGEDDQAFEKEVENKKAKALKRQNRRNARTKKAPSAIPEEEE